ANRGQLLGGFAPIRIEYTVSDEDSDSVNATFEYSLNGGVDFVPCEEGIDWASEGTFDLESRPFALGGVRHQFTWLPRGDFIVRPDVLLVRVTVDDTQGTTVSEATIPVLRPPGEEGSARQVPSPDSPGCAGDEIPLASIVADLNGALPAGLLVLCRDTLTVYEDGGGGLWQNPTPLGFPMLEVLGDASFTDIDADDAPELLALFRRTDTSGFEIGLFAIVDNTGFSLEEIERIPVSNDATPALMSARVNDDLRRDIVATYRASDEARLGIWIQRSDGGFDGPTEVIPDLNQTPTGLSAVDFDGDGEDELIAGFSNSTLLYDPVSSMGTSLQSILSVGNRDAALLLDVDNDGSNDLVLGATPLSSSLFLARNLGGPDLETTNLAEPVEVRLS
ncbi:MAG: VCBS repeat-containing protein, partial [Myxococcota bacterium]